MCIGLQCGIPFGEAGNESRGLSFRSYVSKWRGESRRKGTSMDWVGRWLNLYRHVLECMRLEIQLLLWQAILQEGSCYWFLLCKRIFCLYPVLTWTIFFFFYCSNLGKHYKQNSRSEKYVIYFFLFSITERLTIHQMWQIFIIFSNVSPDDSSKHPVYEAARYRRVATTQQCS